MIKQMEAKNQFSEWLAGGDSMEVDGKIEATRIGVAAVGITVWGITLNEWVAIVTIAYLMLQILILIPKIYHSIRTAFQRHTLKTK